MRDSGQKQAVMMIKCVNVVGEHTRECLAIDLAGSISFKCVVDVLSKLLSIHGAPLFMRSDTALSS